MELWKQWSLLSVVVVTGLGKSWKILRVSRSDRIYRAEPIQEAMGGLFCQTEPLDSIIPIEKNNRALVQSHNLDPNQPKSGGLGRSRQGRQ